MNLLKRGLLLSVEAGGGGGGGSMGWFRWWY